MCDGMSLIDADANVDFDVHVDADVFICLASRTRQGAACRM